MMSSKYKQTIFGNRNELSWIVKSTRGMSSLNGIKENTIVSMVITDFFKNDTSTPIFKWLQMKDHNLDRASCMHRQCQKLTIISVRINLHN